MDPHAHWDAVYRQRAPDQVSWFQPEARLSLDFISQANPDRHVSILDVGGGASTLVDGLLALGYEQLTVLDISGAALQHARQRLGSAAHRVSWMEADVLRVGLPAGSIDVWHDRAVFHFLTDAASRHRYVSQVRRLVRPGGHVLVATFAEDGPVEEVFTCLKLPMPVRTDGKPKLHIQGVGGRGKSTTHRVKRNSPAWTQCWGPWPDSRH